MTLCSADGALFRGRANEPELQHVALRGANGVVAVVVGRGAGVGAFDDDRHAGQRGALLTRHLTGDCSLLRERLRRRKKQSREHHEYSFLHNEGYRVLVSTG